MHCSIQRVLNGTCFAFLIISSFLSSAQSETSTGKNVTSDTPVRNVDEVSVDLVVHKGRKPVVDLKPGDIEVTDDGSAVTLSQLRLVSGDRNGDHLVSFLFDRLNPSAASNARDVAKKILKLIPAEGFSFSVFSVDTRLNLLQEFTADRQAIQKAIDVAVSDNATERTQAAATAAKTLLATLRTLPKSPQTLDSVRMAAQAELASLSESRRIAEDQNASPVLAGLLALARSQAVIPGRKLLVYFTAGLRSDPDTRDMLHSITGAANRADVSIYVINGAPVDSKLMQGLMASQAMGSLAAYNRANPLPTGQAAQQPTVFGGGMVSMVSDQITRVEGEGLDRKNDPVAAMASSTGGAYLFLQDNVKKPFRQAVEDLKTYYEAFYVPQKQVYDGKFHQVRVKSLRRGLKVHARAGYFAVPPAAGMRPYELALMKMFAGPSLPADVRFRTDVLRLGELSTGDENTLVVQVPISSLQTRADANTNLLSWHVLIVSEIKDKTGAIVEHFSEDIPGHGALSSKDQVESDCSTMQRHFALPPGEYTLETAVVDRNSGKIAGQSMKFEVAGSGAGPSLSDMALVRRIDPYPYELDPLEPLRFQRGRVVPDLSGSVARGTKDIDLFFLVHADSGASGSATLQLEVMRNGQLVGQAPLQLPKDLGDSFPYMASLRAGSLPAGDYDVRLSLSQNGRVSERETSFTIPGPELASALQDKSNNPGHDTELTTVASAEPVMGIAPPRRAPLVITTLPPDSVVRPSEDELNALIAGARNYAVTYAAKLPNFLCVEITDRSVDSSGRGRWRRKDSFAEALRFLNNKETRKTLEVNGHPSNEKRANMDGPLSLGEFGDLLSSVFQPGSKADFQWKETAALGHGRVQVFEYRVDKQNNSMLLSAGGEKVYAGFHGLVYIDSSTMGVRRITMEADNLPADFSIHSGSVSVDYDYVPVGEHDYLMPVRGTIRVQRGRHETDLNQIVFQNYARFASQSKIVAVP